MLLNLHFYVWNNFKIYFLAYLAYGICGRVLLVPQIHVRVSHRSSINETSSMKHICLICCFHYTKLQKNFIQVDDD